MVDAWAQATPEAWLNVYYIEPDDQGRGWRQSPASFASERRLPVITRVPGWGSINSGLIKAAVSCDAIVIGGFEYASYFIIAVICAVLRKPVILLTDGFSPKRFECESLISRLIKQLTTHLCDAFIANGDVGRRYLSHLGIKNRPIFNQYLCAYTNNITASLEREGASVGVSFRKTLDIPLNAPVLMTCGYLSRRKRVDLIVDALATIHPALRPSLLIVGRGEEEASISAQAATAGVSIYFAGFLEGDALAAAYIASDLFVLASADDPWGLVVHEALAAGLPVVVSDACGCAADFVRNGQNGYIFSSGSVQEVATAIIQAGKLPREQAREVSMALAGAWNPSSAGAEFARCIRSVLSYL